MTARMVSPSALVGGAVTLLAIAVSCGENRTTASRSAAAYDEAQRKGGASPAGEGGQAPGGAPGAAGSHGEHQSPSAAGRLQAPGMDHARTGMDHSRSEGGAAPGQLHAGHSPQAAGQPGAMDHAAMGHSATPRTPLPPPEPEPSSRTAPPGQPAATLQPDALDGPVATSVSDASRAAAMAAEMAAGGHAMQHGSYTHTDAGREGVVPTQAPGSAPATPRTPPSPAAGHQHGGQTAPQPKPSPSPRNEENHP